MIKFQGYQVESLSFNNQEEKADKIELGINSTHNVSYNYDDGICIGRDIIKISDKDDPEKFNMDIVVLSRFTIEPTDDQRKMHVIQIAYPMRNMGTSFPMILSTLFGNISASGPIKMIDCAFPKKYVEQFTGPKFGVEGIRDRLGVHDRPLVNAMIKPNTGWTPEEGADLFYQASRGGVDIIKDDELMPCNEDFCPQKDRVTLFMEIAKNLLPFITDGATLQLGIGNMPNTLGTLIADSDIKDLGMTGG